MDDDLKPLEARQFREALDRELTAVGATESARRRLRERLQEPVPVRHSARWAIPLATAAAVIAVAGIPALLKGDPTPKPVVPGVSVPSVQPTQSPSKPLRTAEPLPTSTTTTTEAPAPSSAQPTPKVTTPPPTATPILTPMVIPPPATLSTIISPPPTAPPSVTASATTSQPSGASTP